MELVEAVRVINRITKRRQYMATKPQMVKVMVFLKKVQVQRLDSKVRKSEAKTNRSALIRTAIDASLKAS